MKKNILISLGVIVIAGLAWYFYNTEKYAPTTYINNTPSGEVTVNETTNTISSSTPTYTMEVVGVHKDATSCYTVIQDSVYDLTAWVNMHPGGKGAILSICGINGTEKFIKKHKGGEKFMNILARYKIGKLI